MVRRLLLLHLFGSMFLGARAEAQMWNLPGLESVAVFGRLSKEHPKGPWGDLRDTLLGGGFETYYRIVELPESGRGWSAQLAVGYDFIRLDQRSSPAAPEAFPLFGSINTVPDLTVYLNHRFGRWGVYTGAGLGLAQLKNVRAYDSAGRIYKLEGDIWAPSANIGAYVQPFGAKVDVVFYGELSYEGMNFPSIAYTLPADVKALPPELPRSLRAQGLYMSVGIEIELPSKKKDEPKTKK
jgi:hypothetical protein